MILAILVLLLIVLFVFVVSLGVDAVNAEQTLAGSIGPACEAAVQRQPKTPYPFEVPRTGPLQRARVAPAL